MLRWYQSKLAKQPILTSAVSSAVLFGCGDILAQQAVDRKGFDKHDVARTVRMAAYGGAVFGPAATTWYVILQRHVAFKNYFSTVATRVTLDQAVFAPLHLTAFLSSMAYLEGADPKERLRTAFLPTYKANLMIWPLVQCINFSIVPLDYRVLFVNVISLGWNCILSLLNSGDK